MRQIQAVALLFNATDEQAQQIAKEFKLTETISCTSEYQDGESQYVLDLSKGELLKMTFKKAMPSFLKRIKVAKKFDLKYVTKHDIHDFRGCEKDIQQILMSYGTLEAFNRDKDFIKDNLLIYQNASEFSFFDKLEATHNRHCVTVCSQQEYDQVCHIFKALGYSRYQDGWREKPVFPCPIYTDEGKFFFFTEDAENSIQDLESVLLPRVKMTVKELSDLFKEILNDARATQNEPTTH